MGLTGEHPFVQARFSAVHSVDRPISADGAGAEKELVEPDCFQHRLEAPQGIGGWTGLSHIWAACCRLVRSGRQSVSRFGRSLCHSEDGRVSSAEGMFSLRFETAQAAFYPQ